MTMTMLYMYFSRGIRNEACAQQFGKRSLWTGTVATTTLAMELVLALALVSLLVLVLARVPVRLRVRVLVLILLLILLVTNHVSFAGFPIVEKHAIVSSECDNIILKNGEEISAKIVEITPDIIKYKKCNNLDWPLMSI